MLKIISVFILASMCFVSQAQKGYTNHSILSGKIEALAKSNPSVCTVRSLIKTSGGRDIWLITIGTGDKDNKPGIAVFGGVEGNYLLGREIATGLAESLVVARKDLLSKVTFYIFPDVSPDATAQYFAPLRYERTVNSRAVDDDKDFSSGEDPFEDLDKDGFISHVRVYDPSGRYVADPDDDRIIREADIEKGLTGGFRYFSEGIDNDDDGRFNEDGEGGVNFNRNFTFDYEEFGPNSGLHPVSEPEVKAVADFLYDRFNIFAVFSFGPQDNLGQPMKTGQPGQDRRITSIMQSDEAVNKLVSEKYHAITGLKGSPVTVKTPGNLMEWAYFHYGRYSFSTPGWWFPVEKGKNPEVEFLKYAEKNKMEDVFIPWREITHPAFPGKKAEAGGIKPFALMNPPVDSVNKITERHVEFLSTIAAMHPELEFSEIKTENIGDDIFRLEINIHNKGVFATMAQVGEVNSWTRIMRLSVEPAKGQEILSGRKVQRINRLEGGQSAEFSWLIKGKGSVKITAGAVNTGIISSNADLR